MHQQKTTTSAATINTVNQQKDNNYMDGAAIPALASMFFLVVASLGSSDSQQTTTSLTKNAITAHNHMIAAQAHATASTAPVSTAAHNIATPPSQQPAQSIPATNRPDSHIQAPQKPLRTKLQSHRNSSNTRKWLNKH